MSLIEVISVFLALKVLLTTIFAGVTFYILAHFKHVKFIKRGHHY